MPKRYYYLIGFLILIIILSRIDFYKLYNIILKVNLSKFFLINLLLAPIILLKFLRWRYILQLQSIYCSVRNSFLIYLSGIYAGLATPGRLGEAFKALCLRNEKNVPMGKGLATIFIDRLCDLYLLFSFGLFGLWKFYRFVNNRLILVIMVFSLIIFPFVLLNKKLITGLAGCLRHISFFRKHKVRIRFHYEEFYNSIKKIKVRQVLLLFGITLSALLIYFWQCQRLISLIGVKVPFSVTAFFIPVITLISLLPITMMGIGTREVTLIYLFSLIGLKAEEAVCAAFLIFVSCYVLTGIIGFFGWHIKLKEPK